MARRTALKPEDKRLLERIRGQHFTVEELRWVLTHLDPRAPTLVIQEVYAKLIEVQANGGETSRTVDPSATPW